MVGEVQVHAVTCNGASEVSHSSNFGPDMRALRRSDHQPPPWDPLKPNDLAFTRFWEGSRCKIRRMSLAIPLNTTKHRFL
jgi:hypothetical protein